MFAYESDLDRVEEGVEEFRFVFKKFECFWKDVKSKKPPILLNRRPSNYFGGLDETRTRDPMRDRHVF